MLAARCLDNNVVRVTDTFPARLGRDIGGTPLVPLARLFPRDDVRVLAKMESRNPTGSAKDRSALGIIRDAWEAGRLRPGTVVVESSSGNLAMAAARLAALLGFRFECVVDPRANARTIAAIEAYGATVHRVTEPDPDTDDFLVARLNRVRELVARQPGAISLDQYSNVAAIRAHADGTMREIVEAIGAPERMYVATSTTGTIGGCLKVVCDDGLPTQVTAVDAEGSVLFGGARGRRLLSGYGAGFVPALAAHADPARVVRVDDLTAIAAARALALTEGVLAGASTGAVMAAALRDHASLPPGATVVVMVHDGGMPYLDTVYDDDWVRRSFDLTTDQLRRRVDALLGSA